MWIISWTCSGEQWQRSDVRSHAPRKVAPTDHAGRADYDPSIGVTVPEALRRVEDEAL